MPRTSSSVRADIRHPLNLRNGSATFGIALVGLLSANLVPLMLIALDVNGMDPVRAGAVLTFSLLATAITCIFAARWANGGNRRLIGMTGLILTAAGFGTAALLPVSWFLTAGVVVGGIGAGLAGAAAGGAFAALRESVRVSGINGLVNRVVVSVLLFVLPLLGLSTFSVFGTIAAIALALLPIAHWLPSSPVVEEELLPADSQQSTVSDATLMRGGTVTGVVLLICFTVWGLSEDSVWAVVGTIGIVNVGVTETELGAILSLATLAGLVAPLIVSITGNRFGRTIPLVVAIVGTMVLKALLGTLTTPVVFVIVLMLWSVLYMAAFMYIISVAAALDATGRWSGPILGAYLIGSSLAPLFATAALELLDIMMFGIALAVLSAAVVVPVFLVSKQADRVERSLTSSLDRQRLGGPQ